MENKENVFWTEVDKGLVAHKQRRPWLAARTGISLGRINNWYVRGTLPRVDDAVRIADALEIPVRQLVTGEEELNLNHLPPQGQDLLKRFTSLSDAQKQQVLMIGRALMVLIDQGWLDVPFTAYYQMMHPGGRPPSGSLLPSGQGPGEYNPG